MVFPVKDEPRPGDPQQHYGVCMCTIAGSICADSNLLVLLHDVLHVRSVGLARTLLTEPLHIRHLIADEYDCCLV